jgi:AcrR family transcriptional regulator
MSVQRKSKPSKPATAKAPRPYRMRDRLERMEETRRRIAQATVELHATIGPARTSISAIAERAGVQRHTVYYHFPDLVSLFRACTEHGLRMIGPPDPETWRAIPDPVERVHHGLGQVYPIYRQNARMVGNVVRDMATFPELVEGSQQFLELIEAYFQALADGWPPDLPQRPALETALRHALDFGTWMSLTRQGLSDEQARDAMTSFVTVMAGGSDPPATRAETS